MNTLLTWLGTRDIESMSDGSSAAITSIVSHSPEHFDKIVILANQLEEKWHQFEKHLQKKIAILQKPVAEIEFIKARISSPIDYDDIAPVTDKYISHLSQNSTSLYINLTSGTPAMTALAVLIGKSKANVTFCQSSSKTPYQEVHIPLDFSATYRMGAAKSIANESSELSQAQHAFENLTQHSVAMKSVISKAKRIAASEVPALILGETGTGKEVMATAIHQGSLRHKKPIKTVNCGALSPTLVESTLFGHKKGAFTGAEKDYPGVFEQADGGTLFLDEVGELSLDIQVKLLRALQQGEVTRLGDTKTVKVDVRVIAATHQDLVQMVAKGQFREDLFYRLAVGVIQMPALRERTDDIPQLCTELIDQINQTGQRHPDFISKKISDKGIKFIKSQVWQGNIRELWNTLNRASLFSEKAVLCEEELQNALIQRVSSNQIDDVYLAYHDQVNLSELLDSYKKRYIVAALKASGNVKTHATKMLGLKDHQTLTNWMKKLGIDPVQD